MSEGSSHGLLLHRKAPFMKPTSAVFHFSSTCLRSSSRRDRVVHHQQPNPDQQQLSSMTNRWCHTSMDRCISSRSVFFLSSLTCQSASVFSLSPIWRRASALNFCFHASSCSSCSDSSSARACTHLPTEHKNPTDRSDMATQLGSAESSQGRQAGLLCQYLKDACRSTLANRPLSLLMPVCSHFSTQTSVLCAVTGM